MNTFTINLNQSVVVGGTFNILPFFDAIKIHDEIIRLKADLSFDREAYLNAKNVQEIYMIRNAFKHQLDKIESLQLLLDCIVDFKKKS